MTACDFPRRRYPCDECPIRADNAGNPASKFPAIRWRELTASVESAGGFGPVFGSPMFGCHKGKPGQPGEDLACAGWLASFGAAHPRVRLAVATGQLDPSDLSPGENWPPLFTEWRDLVRVQTADGED